LAFARKLIALSHGRMQFPVFTVRTLDGYSHADAAEEGRAAAAFPSTQQR
jgi:hypothetical protein